MRRINVFIILWHFLVVLALPFDALRRHKARTLLCFWFLTSAVRIHTPGPFKNLLVQSLMQWSLHCGQLTYQALKQDGDKDAEKILDALDLPDGVKEQLRKDANKGHRPNDRLH